MKINPPPFSDIQSCMRAHGNPGCTPQRTIEFLMAPGYNYESVIESLQQAIERGKIYLNSAGHVELALESEEPPVTKSRLYYEAHVTVDAGTDFAEFKNISSRNGWRSSRFDEDEVDQYHGKWFASGRADDLDYLKNSIRDFVKDLGDTGYNVIRWKVEDTLLDSKYGDVL